MNAALNRKQTSVSLDATLIAQAKKLRVNVSRACEKGLVLELRKVREEQWLAENRDKLIAWGEWLERNGDPLEELRQF